MKTLLKLWTLVAFLALTPWSSAQKGMDRVRPGTSGAATQSAKGPLVFEGVVLSPEGAPAEGAFVLSSAGGRATTDHAGAFRLEVPMPIEANTVVITAVTKDSRSLTASREVRLGGVAAQVRVTPLLLAESLPCHPRWLPAFGSAPGVPQGEVRALAVMDDGGGPALFVGGDFSFVGGIEAHHIAKWDGTSWTALGNGVDDRVDHLTVFDDGGGPRLYALGSFVFASGVLTQGAATWDGSSWTNLGFFGSVDRLEVFDDGTGPALHGIVSASNVGRLYRLEGTDWFLLAESEQHVYSALAVFDDGNGEALYVGGAHVVGSTYQNYVAVWDGSSLTPVVDPVESGWVRDLAVFDDGGGDSLYAGGNFFVFGGSAAKGVAKWDGSSWSALGSGVGTGPATVLRLKVFDDGGGEALYAGGSFDTAGGIEANHVARWDGSVWSSLGAGLDEAVLDMAVFDGGDGPELYLGGSFEQAGGNSALGIASWSGSDWSALSKGLSDDVRVLLTSQEAGAPVLYAAGAFGSVDGVPANGLARWDGADWTALGDGVVGEVLALASFDDGDGPELYAGGSFLEAGGSSANHVAKWDGANWAPLGSGTDDEVRSLAVYDGALYAGGPFDTAGGVAAASIARWDGTDWSAVGDALQGGVLRTVDDLLVFDDGGGAALYAAGNFYIPGDGGRVAKWNGFTWDALGGDWGGEVKCLSVFDDGTGAALYAGGTFYEIEGQPRNRIARWNGSSWESLGDGLNGIVVDLAVFDDGLEPALYAAGSFNSSGGLAVSQLGRWDGTDWSPVPNDLSDGVLVLASFHTHGRRALFVGGEFSASTEEDSFLAIWGCRPAPVHQTDPVGSVSR